ncbi:MAG TPA: YihY family inner membrane protein [Haliangium sp.]|nr:YihY family inner membrane protein [Haliangium sp.]
MAGSDKHPWIEQLSILWDQEALARRVDPYRHKPGMQAFAVRQFEALVVTVHSLFDEELLRRAASLTYYTLLSLVPLLAVGFALFEVFGGLAAVKEPLKEFILENIAVGRQEEIGTWLEQFVSNINAGAIAGVGVLVLFYSAVGLLTNIESSFNRIWGIDRDRPLHMRFAIYWCIVTLAPPLLGISISFSAQLQSSAFASVVLAWLPFGLGNLVVVLSTTVMVAVAFVLSFVIVPNTKVHLKYAMLGGVLASILWNLTKALYIWFIAGSVKYSAVYGALSALPLLMIWLYLSWIIVLFGVTYTRVVQTYSAERLMKSTPVLSHNAIEHVAGHLVLEVARSFHRGEGSLSTVALSERTGAPPAVLRPILRTLTEHHVLIELSELGEGGEELCYVPGRGLADLSLADAIRALRHHGDDIEVPPTDQGHERVREILAGADHAAMAHLANQDLGTLVKIAPSAAMSAAVDALVGAVIEPGTETTRPAPTQAVRETVNHAVP